MRCIICGSGYLIQRHHRFHDTKWARALYGKLMDLPINIMDVCAHCHTGHNSVKLVHWTEKEFCAHLDIAPRSKTERKAP